MYFLILVSDLPHFLLFVVFFLGMRLYFSDTQIIVHVRETDCQGEVTHNMEISNYIITREEKRFVSCMKQ